MTSTFSVARFAGFIFVGAFIALLIDRLALFTFRAANASP
jgi:hypothetical protein